jgi:hypothetical protein
MQRMPAAIAARRPLSESSKMTASSGCTPSFSAAWRKSDRIGLHLAGVIDGGDVVEVIVQAELVHPRVDPCARAAGGDGDAQAERIGLLQKIRDTGKKVQMLAQLALVGLAGDLDGVPVETRDR